MSKVKQAEADALQALSNAILLVGHQIEQGRGVGFFSNLKYKAFGTAEPKPLPNPTKPTH